MHCAVRSIFLFIFSAMLSASAIISEVYQRTRYDSRDQWVEIYNDSPLPFDLSGCRLSTNWCATGSERVIMPWCSGGGTLTNAGLRTDTAVIPPFGYAVVLDRDFTNDEAFDIPPAAENVIVCTVNASSLVEGTFSSGKCVVLKDASNIPIDSAGTPQDSADGLPDYGIRFGVSQERIACQSPDAATNWGASLAPSGHTIGRRNSLASYYCGGVPVRLALNPFTIPSAVIGIPFPVEVFALTAAGGIDGCFHGRASVSFTDDIDIKFYEALREYSKEDRSISFAMRNGRSGVFYLRSRHAGVKRVSLFGAVSGASSVDIGVFSGAGAGTLCLSEIMYANTGSPDYFRILAGNRLLTNVRWLELFNRGNVPVDITGYTLEKRSESTASSTYDYRIPSGMIAPGGHIVLAESAEFSLMYPNTPSVVVNFGGLSQEQTLVIRDTLYRPVDVVAYDLSSYMEDTARRGNVNGIAGTIYGRECISLERISCTRSGLMKENWANARRAYGSAVYLMRGTSTVTNTNEVAVLASPGASNSILLDARPTLSVQLDRKRYVYSRGVALGISFSVNAPCRCDVKVYTKSGRYIGALASGLIPAVDSTETVPFIGSVEGRVLVPDLYFLELSAADDHTGISARSRYYFAVKD